MKKGEQNEYSPQNMPKGVIYHIHSDTKPADDDRRWNRVSPEQALSLLSGYGKSNYGSGRALVHFDSMIKDGLNRGWVWHIGHTRTYRVE